MFSLGVDIGGSHIAVGVFDHNYKHLIENTCLNARVNPLASSEEILSIWTDTIKASISRLHAPFAGIGLAMPGPFDYYNGISKIQDVEKFLALYDVNLRDELANRLGIVPSGIRFINDASAFSIAEALLGEASAYRNVVAITLGTGLGASFIRDAKPVIQDDDVPEGGFLYNQYYQNQLADDLFSTRGLTEAYLNRTGVSLADVKAISVRVEHDKNASLVFAGFGESLGDFLSPYLKDFGAEVLVLGGNISKAFEFFEKPLKEKLSFLKKIYVSKLGQEAAIIGSALLLDDAHYNQLEKTLKLM